MSLWSLDAVFTLSGQAIGVGRAGEGAHYHIVDTIIAYGDGALTFVQITSGTRIILLAIVGAGSIALTGGNLAIADPGADLIVSLLATTGLGVLSVSGHTAPDGR